ncbi:hypothetical protein [Thermoanaerobacter pentosaceus]|uniref:Uncharacterized protein n=1 Tax=Thermoanaerobacter pentosaceus TaxID=694059 RepID=A0ABT9M2H7_9THEO|nr:hypothetical protein [Thermoanaerobacter pentosaceus]MDP9750302.1 hypothetical protein [Thermoanaerobacter pentosaceus]
MEKEIMGNKVPLDFNHLLLCYNAIEKARMELYWAVNSSIKAGLRPSNVLPADDVQVELLDNNEIVKLTVPDHPPKYVTGSARTAVKERWINNIAYSLTAIKNKVSFNHIFVFIKFYLPSKYSDVDNSDIKPIIDGIKYAGIVPDDNYKHISFGFNARYSKNPKTEIYLLEYEKIPEKLFKILQQS